MLISDPIFYAQRLYNQSNRTFSGVSMNDDIIERQNVNITAIVMR